jgi:flavorubredoxin
MNPIKIREDIYWVGGIDWELHNFHGYLTKRGSTYNAEIYTSPNGLKGLKAHYMKDWNLEVVETGDRISLGKRTLNFVLTPMVHWPDNMVSYCPEEKIKYIPRDKDLAEI